MVARYTTKLADKIELESEWEVGLAEISFPSEVENVVYGQCYVDLYINDVLIRRMTLPSSHHKRVRSLIDTLHTEQRSQIPLQSHEPLLVEFSYVNGRQNIDKVAREHRYRVQSRLGLHAGLRRIREVSTQHDGKTFGVSDRGGR